MIQIGSTMHHEVAAKLIIAGTENPLKQLISGGFLF